VSSSARCLVVLPTYNEAENVAPLVREVLAQDPSLDVLVVDDASPDGTADRVEELASQETRVRLLRRAGKLGLGSAYQAGFRFGLDHGCARVVTMDCDYSHHPRYLPQILAAMADHHVVIGSRYVPAGGISNWPLHRRMLSRFANFYTRLLLGLPVRDCTSGYRCYDREVLEAVDPFGIRSSGYSFLEEMVWRVHQCGFRIGEVPIVFEDRTRGTSKIDRFEILRASRSTGRRVTCWRRRCTHRGCPSHRGAPSPHFSPARYCCSPGWARVASSARNSSAAWGQPGRSRTARL
jgi:dolichol-phosphate mannosyltransferase